VARVGAEADIGRGEGINLDLRMHVRKEDVQRELRIKTTAAAYGFEPAGQE
jgi:hypothetical protein